MPVARLYRPAPAAGRPGPRLVRARPSPAGRPRRSGWPGRRSPPGENLLLVSPTGTGKTLAAFLAILDRPLPRARRRDARRPASGASTSRRCGASATTSSGTSPCRSRRSAGRSGWTKSPVRVGVRTGDTSAYHRRKLRDEPPHLLITTPESLALMLSQPAWHDAWRGRPAPDRRRGPRPRPDQARGRPGRLARTPGGQGRGRPGAASASRRPAGRPSRSPGSWSGRRGPAGWSRPRAPDGSRRPGIDVESLLRPDEAPAPRPDLSPAAPPAPRGDRPGRTTVVFANTRAFTEKITHDLRKELGRRARGRRRPPLGPRRRPPARGRGRP